MIIHKGEISYLFAYLKAFIVQTRGKKYLLEQADPRHWERTARTGIESFHSTVCHVFASCRLDKVRREHYRAIQGSLLRCVLAVCEAHAVGGRSMVTFSTGIPWEAEETFRQGR